MRTLSPRTFDVVLTAAVMTAAVTEALLLEGIVGPRWANVLIAGAASLPLLWRRTHPLAAAVTLTAIALPAAAWWTDPSQLVATFFPLLILAYGGGMYAERGASWAVLAVLLAAVAAVSYAAEHTGGVTDFYFPWIIVVLCWLGGRTVRLRLAHAAELHEAAALAVEQRKLEAGPQPGGGFEVVARLPLEREAASVP